LVGVKSAQWKEILPLIMYSTASEMFSAATGLTGEQPTGN
jgi:hypothetical protein